MQFKVKNGTGQITLGMSDIGSYLKIDTPVVVDWHDCRGSIAHYCSLLSNDPTLSETIRESIIGILNEDFTHKEEVLHGHLSPLFQLFKNGRYSLNFLWRKGPFMQRQNNQSEPPNQPFSSIHLHFPQLSDARNSEKVRIEFEQLISKNPDSVYRDDLISWTTSGYYPYWTGREIMATRSSEKLNKKRIQYFFNRISEGERPFILLIDGFFDRGCDSDFDSPAYILDGHHKLMAYKELNISPPICLITYLPETTEEIEFDAELLAGKMYPWQAKHLILHWDEQLPYLHEKMKNPDSHLHKVFKHGWSVIKHPNGQFKEHAFYQYGKIVEGKLRTFHKNGKQKTLQDFMDGKPVWRKSWDEKGRLKQIEVFDKGNIRVWRADRPKEKKKRRRNSYYVRDRDILLVLLLLAVLFGFWLVTRL